MSKEDQLQLLEKMRAKGELTEGEYLARKRRLDTEPDKKSALNPVFESDRLGPRKKKGSKLLPMIIILAIIAAAVWWKFFR